MTSPNLKAVWGENPLMGAVARGQLEVVKDILDGQGRTLAQVARDSGHGEVAEYIESHRSSL